MIYVTHTALDRLGHFKQISDQGAGFLIEISSHQSQGFIECDQETR